MENTGRMKAPVASIVSGDIDKKGAMQADKLLMVSAGLARISHRKRCIGPCDL